MPLDTFTWEPTYSSSAETKAYANIISFGDGYSQRTPKGLNNVANTLSLTFMPSAAQWAAMDSFLRSKAGSTPFLFSYDGGAPLRYICDTWKPQKTGPDVYTVQATFTQVFTNQT